MDVGLQEILARKIQRFMAKQLGDEFDYVVIVGKKDENKPLVVHTLETDDDLCDSLATVIGGMLGVTEEMESKGDA